MKGKCVIGSKKMVLRILLLCLVLSATFSLLVRSDNRFDEIVYAIEKDATQEKVLEVMRKWQGKRMGGWAYIVSVTKDVDLNTVVTLFTKKDRSSGSGVNVVVVLREYLSVRNPTFRIGKRVRFFGTFREVRMRTVVFDDGIIK